MYNRHEAGDWARTTTETASANSVGNHEMLPEYTNSLFSGAWVTIQVAVLSALLACVLGLIGAASKLSPIPPLRWGATLYTTILRGVPDFVMMLLLFYGGQILANNITDAYHWDKIDFDPFTAAIFTLGFIYGAYFTESFRGAFMAVQKGQLEAGAAFGMTPWQVFYRVMFPQMIRYALPSINNNWLVLLKGTAVVSLVNLEELLNRAMVAGSNTKLYMMYLQFASVFYLAFTTLSLLGFRYLERRYSLGVRSGEL